MHIQFTLPCVCMNKAKKLQEKSQNIFSFDPQTQQKKGKIIPCIHRAGHKYVLKAQESDAGGGTN